MDDHYTLGSAVIVRLNHPPEHVYLSGDEVSGKVYFTGAIEDIVTVSMKATLEGHLKQYIHEKVGDHDYYYPHECTFLSRSQQLVVEPTSSRIWAFSFTMPDQTDPCGIDHDLPEDERFDVPSMQPPPDYLTYVHFGGLQDSMINYHIRVDGIRRISGYQSAFEAEKTFHYRPFRREESPAPMPRKRSWAVDCHVQEGEFWRGKIRKAVVDIVSYFPTVFCAGDALVLPIELVTDKKLTTASEIPEILLTRIKVGLCYNTIMRGDRKKKDLVSIYRECPEEILDHKFDEAVVLPRDQLIDLAQFACIVVPDSTPPSFKFWTVSRANYLLVTIRVGFKGRIPSDRKICTYHCKILPKVYQPLEDSMEKPSNEKDPPPPYAGE